MHRLVAHPGETPDALLVDAAVTRGSGGRWHARYMVSGDLSDLDLPRPAPALRRDGLWRDTCFELFAMAPDGSYLECNFAPSGAWAAYRFEGYRAGMRDAEAIEPVAIALEHAAGGSLLIDARFSIGWLAEFPLLRVGLSAVLARRDGSRSYRALAHPPGKPDFHHRDCFALEVTAPRRA
ncbi:DOMON-like domain-containing protein [Sphingomonas baiyangensis]|uniref:DOMON-like domain-containing protein n=1 Tax=Sphingomonas baiyangensis TaxID=2572576 RepID=A0A4U1L361_9SPHN|nr:DOMON-like domain-containing protein [Sphingomonas baiyangensis]TKD50505.1 DOMON-like domain-containing protein [Sphingomonas baiyangensis]